MMPVRETPKSASSSVLVFQMARRYLKSVKVACSVPRIAAMRTFFLRVARVSSGRTTISDKLQN